MANIGNENTIEDFKNAYIKDTNKQVLKTFSRDEQLSIILLKRSEMQNKEFDDNDLALMMRYSTAVDEVESDDEESEDDDILKKRKAKGISKKRKATKSKKRKAKKSKKQRKIKKKSKTFRRFA